MNAIPSGYIVMPIEMLFALGITISILVCLFLIIILRMPPEARTLWKIRNFGGRILLLFNPDGSFEILRAKQLTDMPILQTGRNEYWIMTERNPHTIRFIAEGCRVPVYIAWSEKALAFNPSELRKLDREVKQYMEKLVETGKLSQDKPVKIGELKLMNPQSIQAIKGFLSSQVKALMDVTEAKAWAEASRVNVKLIALLMFAAFIIIVALAFISGMGILGGK